MAKRRTFRQLVRRTCINIIWQFALAILVIYLVPLLFTAVSADGGTRAILNIFDWIVICLALVSIISINMFVMFRKIKSDLDTVYDESLWIVEGDKPATDRAVNLEEVYQTTEHIRQMKTKISSMLESEKRQKEELVFQISAASHDIRTPLTVIKGNSEFLATTSLDEVQSGCVDDLLDASSRMESYTDSLISYTKTYAAEPSFVTCTLGEICDEITRHAETIVGTSASFSVERSVDPSVSISVCPDLLNLAVGNLVSNACAYSSGERRIVLSFSAEPQFSVSVWNSGSSVSPELRENFGKLFYREDKTRSQNKKHYGIGLAYVSRVASLHGGSSWITNRDNGVEAGIKIDL